MGSDVELPDLIDLEDIRARAEKRIAHFIPIRDEAQAEIDRAEAVLLKLRGKKPRRKAVTTKQVVENTYCQLLTALGTHCWAIDTLAAKSGFSHSTVSVYSAEAERRGDVTREKRGRGLKLRLTEQGMDLVTRCNDVPVDAGAQNGTDPLLVS